MKMDTSGKCLLVYACMYLCLCVNIIIMYMYTAAHVYMYIRLKIWQGIRFDGWVGLSFHIISEYMYLSLCYTIVGTCMHTCTCTCLRVRFLWCIPPVYMYVAIFSVH